MFLHQVHKMNLHIFYVLKLKKLNPNYVSWVFFQQNVTENEFRVISKSTKDNGTLNLMTILESDIVKDRKNFCTNRKNLIN